MKENLVFKIDLKNYRWKSDDDKIWDVEGIG